jgi:hypothetical protein
MENKSTNWESTFVEYENVLYCVIKAKIDYMAEVPEINFVVFSNEDEGIMTITMKGSPLTEMLILAQPLSYWKENRPELIL